MKTKNPAEALPVALRQYRTSAGLTQAQLGDRAGLSGFWISHYESGRRMPTVENLCRLADALELDVGVLLGR